MKNVFLLALLTLVTYAFAKEPVAMESISDADSYKVEKPVKEQAPGRKLAGQKKKKGVVEVEARAELPSSDPDSEVQFWKYSEEE